MPVRYGPYEHYMIFSCVLIDAVDSRPTRSYSTRRRDHSPEGSTVSDSTAVLMSAPPTGMHNTAEPVPEPELEEPSYRTCDDPVIPYRARGDSELEASGYKTRGHKEDDSELAFSTFCIFSILQGFVHGNLKHYQHYLTDLRRAQD